MEILKNKSIALQLHPLAIERMTITNIALHL